MDNLKPKFCLVNRTSYPYSNAGSGQVLRCQVPHGAAQRVRLGAEGHRLHRAEGAAGAQEIGLQHDSRLGLQIQGESETVVGVVRSLLITKNLTPSIR